MVEKPLIYTFAEKISDRELITLMAGRGEVRTGREEAVVRYYLDTFDWRLVRAGTVLEVASRSTGYIVNWRRLKTGTPLVTMTVKRIPTGAGDFFAPNIRKLMQSILGRRTLENRISLKSRELDYAILNKERKVVARLERRNERAHIDRSTDQILLPEYVYLVPYRGYEDELEKLQRRVCGKARLVPVDSDPIEQVLERLGIDPEQYNNRPSFELRPDQPALEVLRQIQAAFLRIMKQNVEGASRGDDPEFLHDFLVAERRTRCMLNQYPGVFPARGLAQIIQDLEWAESAATPVRDLDIYLDLVDEFLGKVDSTHRRALKPLFRYLHDQKRNEQRRMRIALESPRFKQVLRRWGDYLKAKPEGDLGSWDAATPIKVMVDRCLERLFGELMEHGRKAIAESSDSALCELHQFSKKLGYQFQVFQSIFPEKRLKPLMNEHERLQSSLNRFRDLHVQHQTLGRYAEKMRLEQQAMPVSVEAIDRLLEKLGAERDVERRRACKRFEKFERKKSRKQFASILSEKDSGGDGKA